MRRILLASAALIASPAAAQDNAHGDHSEHQRQDAPAEQTESDATAEEPTEAQANPLGQIRIAPPLPDPAPQDAMDHAAMDHAAMNHTVPTQDIPSGPPPPRAFEGPDHAADLFFDEQRMAQARSYNHAAHGGSATGVVLAERLETRIADGADGYVWDISAWYGTATEKLAIKSEGEGEFGGGVEDAEVQLLWSHAIGPWFDMQAGVRLDVEPDTRAHAVLGVAGLAPYMIHVDSAAFLSDEGDLTARIEAEHDIRLSQKLILQPRVEFELSAQDIPERDIGAGLSSVSAGARLRYAFIPEFAPYFGVEYSAATGRTADIIRAAGDDPDGVVVLIGLRAWF